MQHTEEGITEHESRTGEVHETANTFDVPSRLLHDNPNDQQQSEIEPPLPRKEIVDDIHDRQPTKSSDSHGARTVEHGAGSANTITFAPKIVLKALKIPKASSD